MEPDYDVRLTLDQIAVKRGADKGSCHPVKPHSYCEHYERAFSHLRDEKIKILEIGVGGGESIQMWLDYFWDAHVYGCDIVSNTNIYNTHFPVGSHNPNPRYDFLQVDQGDIVGWQFCLEYSGRDFSIIIDDGSHMAKDFQITFEWLWPTVVPGGHYAIEDLNVGSTPGSVFLTPGYPTHMQWLVKKVEEMNSGISDIAEIHLSPELAIFKKKA